MKIGYRIKDLRTQQRITLKDVAKKTGLTTSFLSQLERDITSPSIGSLEKIASALNTKVGYFFEREGAKELIFVKKDFGKKVIDKEKNISYETLASGMLNIKMQPQAFTLQPGAELTNEVAHSHGEIFGMVLKGGIEFLCGEEKLILEEGDSIYCASAKKPQRIKNIGSAETKLLWIVFMPD